MRTTRKLDEEIFVEGGLMEEVVGEEVGWALTRRELK
jgi:hypothetical protein